MSDVQPSYGSSTAKLIVLAIAMFVVGTNAFVIAGLLPQIATSLHTTPTAAGYAISGYSLVVAVAAPAVAILLPRVPRPLLLGVGAAVFALGSALAILAPTLPLFITGRAVAGLGGAALVPVATSAAASLVPPERRGKALALVGAGFTLATAVGSPLGTALGGAFGWRTPLWAVVVLGAALAVLIPVLVRDVPLPPHTTLLRRFAPLRNPRILTALAATMLLICAFNVVYIQSAAVTSDATGGSAGALAVLLLVYGLAGVIGNSVAGPLTDRFGSRRIAAGALAGQLVVLLALAFVLHSFAADVAVFAIWGIAAFAAAVPLQHRLVTIDPDQAATALSWYSTAMYLGIAAAPALGGAALAGGGASAVPLVGAAACGAALLLFLLGYARRARLGLQPA